MGVYAKRDYFWVLMTQLWSEKMHYEDLFVVFICLLFCTVERPKETLANWHGVVVPLLNCLREGCVSKVTFDCVLPGERQDSLKSGRTTCAGNSRNAWEFDATRGYPGEDITSHH